MVVKNGVHLILNQHVFVILPWIQRKYITTLEKLHKSFPLFQAEYIAKKFNFSEQSLSFVFCLRNFLKSLLLLNFTKLLSLDVGVLFRSLDATVVFFVNAVELSNQIYILLLYETG